MKKNFETKEERPIRLDYYLLGAVALWSILVGLSLAWNLRTVKSGTLEAARIEARTAFDKDVVYRRWNAASGGVYAPVTGVTQPNPYLSVPEREITTPKGKELTKINPAYMTRQVHELGLKTHGIRGHITSLNPIRPANAPDSWETRALKAFQTGVEEVSSTEEIGGNEYTRLMRPLLTEEGCLKCHAIQGYKLGDIRGGISVSIPMAPLMAIAQTHILALCIGHGLLWLAGLVGIGFGFRRLNQQIHKGIEMEKVLRESEARYRSLIYKIQAAVVVHDVDSRIIVCNPKAQELLGMTEDQILGRKENDPRWKFLSGDGEILSFNEFPINQVLTTRKPLRDFTACIYRPKEVDHMWVLINAEPVFDYKEKIQQVIVTFMNITELKRSEENLKKNKAFLNATGRMAKVGGWELDLNTLEVRWTEETARIHEVPLNYVPPLDEAIKFYPPEERPGLDEVIKRAIEYGESYDREMRFITATGKHLWVHAICNPQVVDGKTEKLSGTFQDITARKNAEKALLQERDKLRDALAQINILSGMLPICASCKKIRDDKGYWNQIESYIRDHSEAEFTHSICPDCIKKLYPELDI